MEALNLPTDVIWNSEQTSSLSPFYYNNASTEELLIFEDSFANDISIPSDNDLLKTTQSMELQFSAEEFNELLNMQQTLEEQMTISDSVTSNTESNLDQWLDQPINILLDEYTLDSNARVYPVKGNTAQLLNEFNRIYNTVELTHLTPLETPPQTPPQSPEQIYLDDSIKNQCAHYLQQNASDIPNYQLSQYSQESAQEQSTSIPSLFEQAVNLIQETIDSNDDCKIVAEVDELVRSRAQDMIEYSMDDDSSSYAGSSSCYSPHSEISSGNTEDTDWIPNVANQHYKSLAVVGAASKINKIQKRKPRLNRRSYEDRQSRKKEQNKNAANRYRLKKKAEIEILADEERDLLKRNEILKGNLVDISREEKCLKSLLRELFRAKGLIN